MRIGILVFDGAEELDWVGPWEVLALWAQRWPEDDVSVFTVAPGREVVSCARGLRILPDHASLAAAPEPELVLCPGGPGVEEAAKDEMLLGWLRRLAKQGTVLASVCTGALVYAAAGLLDGRAATTHRMALDDLRESGRDIEVVPNVRFVDDGDVVTSAGVSAGIDLALHLVERFGSKDRAAEIQALLEYASPTAQEEG